MGHSRWESLSSARLRARSRAVLFEHLMGFEDCELTGKCLGSYHLSFPTLPQLEDRFLHLL